MFTSITVFQVTAGMPSSSADIADLLEPHPFVPTQPTQDLSIGWVPPREENGALVEAIAGAWIARISIETRSVPGSAIKDAVEKKAAEIEEQTGRKPGKKERRDIKEDCLLELLPHAFPKRSQVPVWFAPQQGWLVLGTTSTGKIDEIVTQLVRVLPDFCVTQINTQASPQSQMAAWLQLKEAPGAFDFGHSCELKATDDSKATAKFASHHLLGDEVLSHLVMGKMPTKMSMSWDGRVEFMLDTSMHLTKLNFGLIEEATTDEKVDAFDATVALETGELIKLINDMVEVLGGVLYPGQQPNDAEQDDAQGQADVSAVGAPGANVASSATASTPPPADRAASGDPEDVEAQHERGEAVGAPF
ncbi:recombination-associated protein RdgC [Hydrogenophaga sp. 2FB]|uniref:recombination-associated protein RdgC n=1 Tax=Hydrogenophaga sp. 2FB TaxID=2502187 RepID=UPI0010F70A9C|nr:recombination-associated protein RdgC [Hydrogenophaga sp. 2FB]